MQFNVDLHSAVLNLAFKPTVVLWILEVENIMHMCHGLSTIRNTD
jgi:hypothetical protein